MKISEIDRNLAVQSKLDIKGLQYRNALEEPFDIYGLYRPKETGQYRRLPMEVAERGYAAIRQEGASAFGRIPPMWR